MFEHCLYFNTTSLARHLEREWAKAFKPFGLTPPQAFMMRIILEKQPITGTELARMLNISKATCSRSVDGLMALGLVARFQADADARSFELCATAQGGRMRDGLNQASGAVTRRIKHMIGDEGFAQTVKHLRDVSASF